MTVVFRASSVQSQKLVGRNLIDKFSKRAGNIFDGERRNDCCRCALEGTAAIDEAGSCLIVAADEVFGLRRFPVR